MKRKTILSCAGALYALLLSAFAQPPVVVPDPAPAPRPLPEGVEKFTIPTTSAENKEISFYLRVPKGYVPGEEGKFYRLLFICPYLNQDGLSVLGDSGQWKKLADERKWFLLTCTFRQTNIDQIKDRKVCYYYPEEFSGKSVFDALSIVRKNYPVDTNRIFTMGISGGAQFVHRFALWAPERVAAAVIHTCSWYDTPMHQSRMVAWLVTGGESDESYDKTLAFVDQLRELGCASVFRSYAGVGHVITKGHGETLSLEFLKFYDDRTKMDLGKKITSVEEDREKAVVKPMEAPFLGDSQSWQYVINTGDAREEIPEDCRVFLPSESVAKAWGEKEKP